MQLYLANKLGPDHEPLDWVRVCYLCVRLYAAFVRHSEHAQGGVVDYTSAIQVGYVGLWGKLGAAVRKYHDAPEATRQRGLSYWRIETQPFTTAEQTRSEDQEMAAACLRLIEELDTPETRGRVAPAEGPDSSLFPEALISTLRMFTEPKEAVND